jgi:hypothetical protein
VATRNSRRLPHIPALALVLLAGMVLLAADRDPLALLFALWAFAAGRWARPRRKRRRLPVILGLAFVLFAGIVLLAADRESLTWLIAAGAFAAGCWAFPHPGARAARQPRRARPRSPATRRSSGDGDR